MHARTPLLLAILATICSVAGCPLLPSDESGLFLVGLDESYAYLEHYEAYSGFETSPSSLWQVDLLSGKTTKLRDRRVRYDTQIAAGFAVCERPTDSGSEIVAEPLDGGDARVLLKRSVTLGGRYDRVVIVLDSRAIARTETGLSVFDLATPDSRVDISVEGNIAEILAAGANTVIARLDDVHAGRDVYVDLETHTVTPVPTMERCGPRLFDAAFVDGELLTVGRQSSSSAQQNALDPDAEQTYLLVALNLSNGTWRTVRSLQYKSPAVFLSGASRDWAVIDIHSIFGPGRVERLSLNGGEDAVVADERTYIPLASRTFGSRLVWLNAEAQELSVSDRPGDAARVFELSIPD